MKKISVLLVDDHKLFREGLKLLLKNLEYINNIEVAANGIEFLEKLKIEIPDIIFMDIEMPEMNGVIATQVAISQYVDLKIIALSMYGDENYYTQMINAGAKGFMLKNSSIQDIEAAISSVLSGNNYFSSEILNQIISNLTNNKSKPKSTILSDRETEVIFHICKGLNNQEIADKLYLSKRTVDKHRENILLKTNTKNTADLVMFAVKNGIVEV